MKLDGKPFDPTAPTGTIKKVIEHLSHAPSDEVWTTDKLSEQIRLARQTIHSAASNPQLKNYRAGSQGKSVVWGNPKAIAEYKKLTGAK